MGVRPDPALFKIPPAEILKVGVFVNEEVDRVEQLVEEHQLDLVQLHGNETPEYCGVLMDHGIQIIKALNPGTDIEAYTKVVQTLLFDTPGQGWGGTGRKFDWSLLEQQNVALPYILSGGIGPEDARVIGELKQKNLLGIDLNSRFELSPGVKDIGLLKDFFIELRK